MSALTVVVPAMRTLPCTESNTDGVEVPMPTFPFASTIKNVVEVASRI